LSGRKFPLWLKLGILFGVVAIVFEALTEFGFWLVSNEVFSFLGFELLRLGDISGFPLFLIALVSNEAVLYLSTLYVHPNVFPNFFGYVVIVVFWFLVGGVVGIGYGKIRKIKK